jgi:hypothetical protein
MEDARRTLRANAELAIERLGPVSRLDFGLNRESVEWVEGFIERQRERLDFDPANLGALADVLGSFLGECLVVATGGEWFRDDEIGAWGVRFPNGSAAFPFAKVDKQFREGLVGGESISSFYDTAVNFVATGRLDRARRPDPDENR